jgi:hypothetical protein
MHSDLSLVPAMDEEGLSFFKTAIANSTCFLEYGCGGSTVYALNTENIKTIISVDTSKEWVEKVGQYVQSKETNLLLNHCDLGVVGDWGRPVNRDQSQSFWRYMVTPWQVARSKGLIPDIVLVDGRFRVASFLYSLICARLGTLIMFDDYLNREDYFVVEKFCQLKEKHGRMGVFYVEHNYSIPEIVSAIAEYSTLTD